MTILLGAGYLKAYLDKVYYRLFNDTSDFKNIGFPISLNVNSY